MSGEWQNSPTPTVLQIVKEKICSLSCIAAKLEEKGLIKGDNFVEHIYVCPVPKLNKCYQYVWEILTKTGARSRVCQCASFFGFLFRSWQTLCISAGGRCAHHSPWAVPFPRGTWVPDYPTYAMCRVSGRKNRCMPGKPIRSKGSLQGRFLKV